MKCTILRTRDKTVSMTLSKLVPRDYIPPVRWSENSVMTSELIAVKTGLNATCSVFALGQKNATIDSPNSSKRNTPPCVEQFLM